MAATKTYRFKMILFGSAAVGKTSLVERFVNNSFQEEYISTLGYNVYEKIIFHEGAELSLMIFDIGGQEKFRELRKKYAEGANTAFLVYDITNQRSFKELSQWRNDLKEFAGDIPFIIVGNKVDLETERQVPKKVAENLSSDLGSLGFFETSAKTGNGVENAFTRLAIVTYENKTK